MDVRNRIGAHPIMRKVTFIELPYDSAHYNERMGRGPIRLIETGLREQLREHQPEVRPIRLPEGFHTEAGAWVELQRLAVIAIRQSVAADSLPILLSGNCGPAALSAVSALGPQTTAVIWFDAHADFNTPETSASGFLDGMGLSILTGHCWRALAERFDGFAPVPEKNVILVGARDFDPAESALLKNSTITQTSDVRSLDKIIGALPRDVQKFYVHVDVDVLDESEGRANSYACPGGMSLDDLRSALNLIRSTEKIAAASLTSYDPADDQDGRIRTAIADLAKLLAS